MDTKQEAILQAVILADPFENQSRYGPLVRGGGKDGEGCSSALPWCLLPLLNTPLIAYTLESLAASQVQNVYIIIQEGAKELQEWLDSSTFSSPTASMNIRIRSTLASTEGDVMREVDALALPGDWLLVRAGYIGNLDLAKAVTDFTAKRKKDPGLLMECLVAPSTRSHVPTLDTHILSSSLQLLHYLRHPRHPPKPRAHFPLELLESVREVVVRTDLESVGVDVCNMEVPALFVENFDYQNLRPDFINGILTSDILGKSICCSVVGQRGSQLATSSPRAKPWAARVTDLASYAHLSKAIISRYAYPLALDEGIPGTDQRYEQRKGRLYAGRSLNQARTCSLGPAAVLGSYTSVGPHTRISHSSVGAQCNIGSYVRIEHSYVFEGAVIEDGCTILNSIVGEGVRVKKGSSITGGSIIGNGVTLGTTAKLEGRRVATEAWDSEEPQTNGSADVLGEGSQAHIWPSEEDALAEEQDSDDEDALDPRNLTFSKLTLQVEDGYLSSTSSASSLSRASSSSSLASDMSHHSSQMSDMSEPPAIAGIGALDTSGESADMAFVKECTSSLDRSFSEGHTVDNTAIELKTLRMASNVPLRRVIGVVVPYLCDQAGVEAITPAKEVGSKVDDIVERWGGLVNSLTGGAESGMVDALLTLQLHCSSGPVNPRLFAAFLQAYYNEDVVTEEAALRWVRDPASRSTGGEAGTKLWQTGAAFVKALMEAESDDDEDDEEDDDE